MRMPAVQMFSCRQYREIFIDESEEVAGIQLAKFGVEISLRGIGSAVVVAVSYTHLDVYKRQPPEPQ